MTYIHLLIMITDNNYNDNINNDIDNELNNGWIVITSLLIYLFMVLDDIINGRRDAKIAPANASKVSFIPMLLLKNM